MTNEEVERAIEFLLEHHSKFSADIDELKEIQRQQTENLNRLTANVEATREEMRTRGEEMQTMREEMRAGFDEMREAVNNLIIANEVTRELAENVARLEVQTSRRVTGLERRVDDLESKQ
jgi:hypothetical protein